MKRLLSLIMGVLFGAGIALALVMRAFANDGAVHKGLSNAVSHVNLNARFADRA